MKWCEIVNIFNQETTVDLDITGVQYDSRKIRQGDLFVCMTGLAADGHNFAEKAVQDGAVALVVEHSLGLDVPQLVVADARLALAAIAEAFFDYPGEKLRLLGVTGTNGKTTTTHLIKEILDDYGVKAGLIGTNHILIGDKIIPSTHTTPESLEISAYLGDMVAAGCKYGVMEVSSHGLKQGRVSALDFCGAGFTNLTQDHLDFHKSFDDYLAAKQILFKNLGKKDKKAFGVINIDDKYAEKFAEVTSVPMVTYGLHENADYCGSNIQITSAGTEFTLKRKNETFSVKTPLLGNFNVYNVLTTIAMLEMEGLPIEFILQSLAKVKQVRGRFEKVKSLYGPTVVVDYAHSPDGLQNIMNTANAMKKGRLILVFGCGGDRDQGKRPKMGRIGGKAADFAIVTSDNPRTENPEDIISMVEAGVKESGGEYVVIVNRREAIKEAIAMANENDLVVIAGKGHEDYQIIGTKKVHFDDFEEAKKALALKNK
ncbi:MAG: UDP-N-acetylmuramoyl-L-alanyl-D-glutamate--2,6-diaminopimelate ligase [Clostridiales bacterium]